VSISRKIFLTLLIKSSILIYKPAAMGKIYLLICLFISIYTFSKAQGFVRIYNSSGDKIAKGHLVDKFNHDSVLILQRNKFTDTISILEVGFIKTKHGIGHNIIIGAAIGAPVGAIIGAASASETDAIVNAFTGETSTPDVGAGIAVGFLGGAATGAAIGAITGAFKNSKTISINGDIQHMA
jgi:hypothetical protein